MSNELTFDDFRKANVARCIKWQGSLDSWSSSDWMTAITGELGELASLIKMRNRERDGIGGNKFSPTDRHIADEIADVATYLDLFAASLGVDLGQCMVDKFNEVSARLGISDRMPVAPSSPPLRDSKDTGEAVSASAVKRFAYFQIGVGDGEPHIVSDLGDLSYLYKWMSAECRDRDMSLFEWADTASVGEFISHRLGTLVRLKDGW